MVSNFLDEFSRLILTLEVDFADGVVSYSSYSLRAEDFAALDLATLGKPSFFGKHQIWDLR